MTQNAPKIPLKITPTNPVAATNLLKNLEYIRQNIYDLHSKNNKKQNYKNITKYLHDLPQTPLRINLQTILKSYDKYLHKIFYNYFNNLTPNSQPYLSPEKVANILTDYKINLPNKITNKKTNQKINNQHNKKNTKKITNEKGWPRK